MKKKEIRDTFEIDGKEERHIVTIANNFNKYFNKIGPKLANEITSNQSHLDFLTKKVYWVKKLFQT